MLLIPVLVQFSTVQVVPEQESIIAIVVALIAGVVSIMTAIITAYFAIRTKKLESELAEIKAEKDARRDYEYEARKNLYKQCEPLLFQLVERSESALEHISNLATAARTGKLSPDGSLFRDTSSYYTVSTVYKLISPIVIYRLIQYRLTLLDLDPLIKSQYYLAKQIYLTFTDHWDFAQMQPRIDYDPESDVSSDEIERCPEKYFRQGVPEGWLDTMIDSLVMNDPDGSLRCARYAEFKDEYSAKQSNDQTFSVPDLFYEFHPKSRPVLWRILITQAHLYEALIRTREMKFSQSDRGKPVLLPITDNAKFDWRSSEEEATKGEVLEEPFSVAQIYLQQHLPHLYEKKGVSGTY